VSRGRARNWPGWRNARRRHFKRTPMMTKDQKIIKSKVGLLELARQLGKLSHCPPFSKRRSPNRPACVPFRFLRHSLTASESEKAPRRKANTARKSVHVVGSRPGMTVRVMHKRIWYKTGAGAGPVVPSHPLANLHRARCGYPPIDDRRQLAAFV
jgi:hypothetical protein